MCAPRTICFVPLVILPLLLGAFFIAMVNHKFSFCCWNVRGLGQTQKCSDILSELLAINPHACFLQETKLDSISTLKQRSFLPKHLNLTHPRPALGSAGGMLSAFSLAHFSLIAMDSGLYTQTTLVSCLASPHRLPLPMFMLLPTMRSSRNSCRSSLPSPPLLPHLG